METNARMLSSIHGLPAFQDNYIWAVQHGDAVAIIDPGDAQPVVRALEARGWKLAAILLTHHHRDHVGGVEALLAHSAVPVYGPANEKLPHCDIRLREGDRVQLPEVALDMEVFDVPGHTAGHIAYFGRAAGQHPVLFCGDTLFASGCGRLFEGTAEQMYDSLGKLSALPDETRVYCAHEYTLSNLRWAQAVEPDNPYIASWTEEAVALRDAGKATVPTRMGHERKVNPFLRATEPAVIEAVARYVGRPVGAGVDAFGALRSWKDNFR